MPSQDDILIDSYTETLSVVIKSKSSLTKY